MPIRVSKVADIIIGWVEFVPGLEDVAKSALFELRPDPRPSAEPHILRRSQKGGSATFLM
jgi:hypothetical protein